MSVKNIPGKLSYLGIPRNRQLLDLTFGDIINIGAVKYENNPAIIVPGKGQLSYKELEKQTLMIASGFVELGLVKGNTVILWSENSMELYLIRLACMRIGVIVADMTPRKSQSEVQYFIELVGAHWLILGEDLGGESFYDMVVSFLPELKESTSSESIKFQALPTLTTVLKIGSQSQSCSGTLSFDELCKLGKELSALKRASEMTTSVQFEDDCLIRFTSGTTGKPKAVSIKHHGLVNEASFLGHLNSYNSTDKICIDISICSNVANVWGILSSLICGSTVVLIHGPPNWNNIIPTIIGENCTCYFSHVDTVRYLLKDKLLKETPPKSLRIMFLIAEQTTVELVQEIKDKFSVPFVVNTYGMTEVGIVFQSLPDDSHVLRSTTVGYPSQMVEVKLIDEDERIVPIGVEGELCVRGVRVVQGKFGVPALDSDGWFHTGDLMVMLESGHCKLLGRMTNIFSIGGHAIIPFEVEEFLGKHPKISDAQVCSVRTESLDEHVAVWIVLNTNELMTVDDVHGFCENKLASFKIPKYVHFGEEIKRNERGKVDKKLLEKKLKELYNL